MDKAIVLSVSKGSAGYVAARGNITGTLTSNSHIVNHKNSNAGDSDTTLEISGTRVLSGGTTDLTVKEYSARLISPIELACDGPVEWQVIEFR